MAALMLRQYLEMPPLERTKDPTQFWSKHKQILPEMHELAMKYVCIPYTSVSSERVFSKAGQLTKSRRKRMHPKHLDYTIFLNSQYQC